MITLALLSAASLIFWTDPGAVASVDFGRPAQGAQPPEIPLTFVREEMGGNSAKVLLRDAQGVLWQAKGGPEARAEAFVTRLVSALGYYAETVVFVRDGRLDGVSSGLRRASGFLRADGAFTWAGLERRDPSVKFLKNVTWNWNDFDSREVKGLRIVTMLVSNWDNKDGRNGRLGPNTGVLQTPVNRVAFVTDWGQSLGAWGRFRFQRSNWNCGDFAAQTPRFVRGVRNGVVSFGYQGQHTNDFTAGITIEDVKWLMQWLGQITDAQLRVGLLASGATADEEVCFAKALRQRIEALRGVTMNSDVHLDLPEVRRGSVSVGQRVPSMPGSRRDAIARTR
ncbi:MAG TPA: hypothetical protein VES20_20375 [Bryobacteraceae bacterium]|nr:hypothetical protein [Bryobacteraceae bacterium]